MFVCLASNGFSFSTRSTGSYPNQPTLGLVRFQVCVPLTNIRKMHLSVVTDQESRIFISIRSLYYVINKSSGEQTEEGTSQGMFGLLLRPFYSIDEYLSWQQLE
ncbi:uncharacterized protein LOC128999269 isoform X2 [Macrosteles quadrilineatus]|uniref:uncharacterized protein LOC128999269 isoform X2 n=1 Tax=Macrosteles quadrilineatus TaxID=74068 RepID=UPI0023E1B170|nr:uncharacterized protein LOC128999269 isoform X2 [Macrosteles quadrilineatus]